MAHAAPTPPTPPPRIPGGHGAPAGGPVALASLFSPDLRPSPNPAYGELRRTNPLWQPFPGLLVASRHRDCAAVLGDPAFGHLADDEVRARRARRPGTLGAGMGDAQLPVRSFPTLNPPEHTRLRRLVARAFTVRRVESLRTRVDALVSGMLDEMERAAGPGRRGVVDPVDSLAAPPRRRAAAPTRDPTSSRTWWRCATRATPSGSSS